MEVRAQGDKRFIPAEQRWRGWHEDYFTCCWRHIQRCYWSSDTFPGHGCPRPGSQTLFKHLVHHRQSERGPSRNPATSNLSIFSPERAHALSAFHALSGTDNTGCFFVKGKPTCWKAFMEAYDEITDGLSQLEEKEQFPLTTQWLWSRSWGASSTYPKQRLLQWVKWDGAYFERNKLNQKGFHHPRQLCDKPS